MQAHLAPTATDTLATPALVLDAQVVRGNVQKMARYTTEVGLALRPHAKTSKSRQVVRMQLDAGAIGLSAAKVGEARAVSSAGDDVLLAYPTLGSDRAEQLAELGLDRTVRAAIDSELALETAVTAANKARVTIGLLVEIDVGLHRTGLQKPSEALALAQRIDRAQGVRLDGIMVYPGHIWDLPAEQAGPLGAVSAILEESLDLWERSGLQAPIVSGGSTPTARQSHLVPQYTEIRPGNYVFNDMNNVRGGYCQLSECAALVICTVISDAVPDHVVVDAGTKTFSSDLCLPAPDSGYGHVVEYPGAKIVHLSEEHARIDTSACDRRPAVGERLSIVPNHICPCVNLQDALWWIDQDEPPRLLPIDGRGKLN